MRTLLITVAAAAFFFASTAQAHVKGPCMPHEIMVAKLKQSYGEQKVGFGLGPRGSAIFELFVAETGTWTILMTPAGSLSCIAASGDNWMIVPFLSGETL